MKDDIDIDTANLGVSKITREEQHPPSIEKVTRCTRISYEYECGPSLLLEDILKDFDDYLDLDLGEDPIDTILALAGQ